MKLLSLKAKNIFSLGDVSLDLKDRGLTLITGWSYDENNGNMAGKSSLANNAIVWCLYGKTVSGVRADDVVNTSTNSKPCYAEVVFEGVDGERYKVYRSRKPNTLSLSQLNDLFDDELAEWTDLTKRNEKDTQELIDKALGRDHSTFIQSDFFGQGRERSFLALPGSEQRAVIEEILPLTSLDEWHTKASAGRKESDTKVNEAYTNCTMQDERVSMAREHLKTLESQMKTWATTNSTEIVLTQHNLNKVQLASSGITQQIKELKDSLPLGPTVELLETYTSLAHQHTLDIAACEYRMGTLSDSISERSNALESCPTCGSLLPIDQIKHNAETLEAEKVERDGLIITKGDLEAKLYHTHAQIGICNETKALEDTIKSKGFEENFILKLDILKKGTNPFSTLVKLSQSSLDKEEEAEVTYRLRLIDERTDREYYSFWNNAFGKDIKNILFEQVCPYLEAKANQYLRELNNGQIKVKFSTIKEMKSGYTKDEFCVTASSDTGSNVFGLFSGAEQQLTSFAVGMALSDLSSMQTEGASQFMILDEPFLYQSPENAENIVNFITQNLGDKSTILLISNEENLAGLIPNRVHVVKRKGISSIDGT